MGDLKERMQKVLSPVLGLYFSDFEIKSAKGCYLTGNDGKQYLDFSSGIATTVTGHCHPKVVRAACDQINKLIHICIGVALYEPYIKLGEEIRNISPVPNAQLFCCQSGSEAVEAAIKLAKYATKRPGIIAFHGAFHGRTMGGLSLTTSKMKYREGYEPLLPECYIAPYNLDSVEKLIKEHRIAAAIIEPIRGEGGYIETSGNFMAGLRILCNKHKVLLIVDEVQTGFGHTGKWFAVEHYRIVPDIITMAKGIASGFTLGGIIASVPLMKKWSPGSHGSTFGGNPVNCAAALATIEVIKEEGLLENAQKLGDYLKSGLLKLQLKYSKLIKEVRGKGLMLGVDFGDNTVVRKIMDDCLNNQLVLISTGGSGTVIRFVPPLIVTKEQIDCALTIFEKALSNV
ncbi:aspartate aminotransferase family protein [Candidatus Margulisiibacteriota bacterium]